MWRLRQALLLLLLLSFSLGQTDPLRSQIVGGHEARPHSRPYMAYLTDNETICGGFLVAPQWVMTAAHCTGDYTVTLGAHNIHHKEDSQQVFSIKGNYMHQGYNNLTKLNDIRLLKLNGSANLSRYINTLYLPTFYQDLPYGTFCSVAGWGLIDSYNVPNTLQEADVTISECNDHWYPYPGMKKWEICSGTPYTYASPSQGDSGGPLVCYGRAQGVISSGKGHLAIYTHIGYYLDWIEEIMKK